MWNMDGDCLMEMYGHTSFIYAISSLAETNEIISSGEDKTMRVWRDGRCEQTILIPAESIWSNCTMPNGDIVAASNDGCLRIFTRNKERFASESELQAYDASVASITLNAKTVGDVNEDKLQPLERLEQPGKKDQEVIMVKSATGAVEAFQWNLSTGKWVKLGEVVDAIGSGRKQIHEGKEYDYVFDVDIAEGRPPLKLPFNVVDNPFVAAQAFITQNELPQSYLEQVAEFIVKNANGATLGGSNAAADPYSDHGRYIPGQAANITNNSVAKSNPDPFTGSDRDNSVKTSVKIIPLPENGYVKFEQCNLPAVFKKLTEFNVQQSDHRLSQSELGSIGNLVNFLQSPSSASMHFSASGFAALVKTFSWPLEQRFPSLDVLRMVVLHVQAIESLNIGTDDDASFPSFVLRVSGLMKGKSVKSSDANTMLALRTICNLCASTSGLKLVVSEMKALMACVSGAWRGSSNKNVFIAYSTVLLNFALASVWVVKDLEIAGTLMNSCVEFGNDGGACADSDSFYRCAVAVGHLLFKYPSLKGPGVDLFLQKLKTHPEDAKLSVVCGELGPLIAK